MSDTQQGHDWWLASDGRWYPPQSRPAPAPPPPPPPPMPSYPPSPATFQWPPAPPFGTPYEFSYTPVSVSPTLGGWLQGMMWASSALSAIAAFLAIAAYASAKEFHRDGSSRSLRELVDSSDAFDAGAGFYLFAWIAAFVLMLVWMNKAHHVTQRLWPGPRSWSSGWTIGGWFIPLAQLVIPKLVLNEIERIAEAPRSGGTVDAGWRRRSTSAIGWVFWIGLAVGIVLIVIGSGLTDDLNASDDQVEAGFVIQAVALWTQAAAIAFGALYFRRVGKRLTTESLRTP
jgi:hypothetical protein